MFLLTKTKNIQSLLEQKLTFVICTVPLSEEKIMELAQAIRDWLNLR